MPPASAGSGNVVTRCFSAVARRLESCFVCFDPGQNRLSVRRITKPTPWFGIRAARRLTGSRPLARIGQPHGGRILSRWTPIALLFAFAVAASTGAIPANAGDAAALAQGFKDADACAQPFAASHDTKAFAGCIQALEAKFAGAAAAKPSYAVGAHFNAWSLADALADAIDKDLFPDIKSRAKASKERQFAMKLFDQFRATQKKQKIADAELAKLIGAPPESLKPVLEYYDGLPKK